MPLEITTINMPFVLNVSVNCYLVRSGEGFMLVDTGRARQRARIEQRLAEAGCQPGDLKLIVLTHGDFDHSGNAAYLRKAFDAPVAIHPDDAGMVERGDMFWNRKPPNPIMRVLSGLIFRLPTADRFTPDLTLGAGDDLSAYGLDARVIALPGHSSGSIGLLTAEGDLFCGDLLANNGMPEVWTIVDDKAAMAASVDALKGFEVRTVYPGHGQPFAMAAFQAAQA